VKIRKSSEATVDISDVKKGDAVSVFITHVAAVSWAATHVPETRLAIHKFLKVGFRSALQVKAVAVVITNPALPGGLRVPLTYHPTRSFSRMGCENPIFRYSAAKSFIDSVHAY
jgi:hypothetical protein